MTCIAEEKGVLCTPDELCGCDNKECNNNDDVKMCLCKIFDFYGYRCASILGFKEDIM